jgi:hypothetical protein
MLDSTVYSLVLSIFVGVAAGYLGSLMVLEKMSLVGDALSHVALPGLAIGISFGFDPYLGAFAFLFDKNLFRSPRRRYVYSGIGNWYFDLWEQFGCS